MNLQIIEIIIALIITKKLLLTLQSNVFLELTKTDKRERLKTRLSSKLKSGKAIVEKYGYIPEGYTHKSLHVTLTANRPNPQGLGLMIQPQSGLLEADEFSQRVSADGSYLKINDVAVWKLLQLHERLLTKHHETFWIDAETKRESGKEYFRVTEIYHTKNPIPSQFDVLLDQGLITVDFLLCRDSGGDTYSFKIKGKARRLLFPESETYNLRVNK